MPPIGRGGVNLDRGKARGRDALGRFGRSALRAKRRTAGRHEDGGNSEGETRHGWAPEARGAWATLQNATTTTVPQPPRRRSRHAAMANHPSLRLVRPRANSSRACRVESSVMTDGTSHKSVRGRRRSCRSRRWRPRAGYERRWAARRRYGGRATALRTTSARPTRAPWRCSTSASFGRAEAYARGDTLCPTSTSDGFAEFAPAFRAWVAMHPLGRRSPHPFGLPDIVSRARQCRGFGSGRRRIRRSVHANHERRTSSRRHSRHRDVLWRSRAAGQHPRLPMVIIAGLICLVGFCRLVITPRA